MNLSSAAAPPPLQYRRCEACGATAILDLTPDTAVPCPHCKGAMLAVAVTGRDILAERKRCADALREYAKGCEDAAAGTKDGNVSGTLAAGKMRALADQMEQGAL